MPRTNLPITNLTANSQTAIAGTAVDPTNGMNVAAFSGVRSNGKFFLYVDNTFAGIKNITIKAGAYPLDATSGPSFRGKLGDLVIPVPASSKAILGPFDSSRFTQADGSLNIDLAAGITGTIQAFVIPSGI